jgi:hypothetical protein
MTELPGIACGGATLDPQLPVVAQDERLAGTASGYGCNAMTGGGVSDGDMPIFLWSVRDDVPETPLLTGKPTAAP